MVNDLSNMKMSFMSSRNGFHSHVLSIAISYGPFHMNHIILPISYEPYHMSHFIWTISYGPFHMNHIIWPISYGPYHIVHLILLKTREITHDRTYINTWLSPDCSVEGRNFAKKLHATYKTITTTVWWLELILSFSHKLYCQSKLLKKCIKLCLKKFSTELKNICLMNAGFWRFDANP